MAPEPSFAKALFRGVVDEGLLLPYPEVHPAERESLRDALGGVRQLGRAMDSARIDREARIPGEVLSRLGELGLFGLSIPERFGGMGLSHTASAHVLEELARQDAAVAVTVGAHHSIGVRGLVRFGTEDQKARYLPRLASGEWIAGFALTEPGAGSDAAAVRTRLERDPDGRAHVLDGNKVWVTNGSVARLFTVFGRSHDGRGHAGDGITALLVERDHGVGVGPDEPTMGIRGCSVASLYFEDVRVPDTNVLGSEGDGFRLAMEILDDGRLGLAAGCVGGCKELIRAAVESCLGRHAFGRPIGEFEMIRGKVSRMMCDTFALESMTYLTTGLADAGVADHSLESAICKVCASETHWRVAHETLQIAGGAGYMADQPYERMLRDARIGLIFEGTNEILRAFISLAGLQPVADARVDLLAALQHPVANLGVLRTHAVTRARSALERPRLQTVHPVLERPAAVFEQGVARLHRAVDRVLRKHGTGVAEKQLVQKRLADGVIDLYGLASVLARTTRAIEARGEEGARREIDMTTGFAALAEPRIARNLDDVDREEDELFKQIATDAYEGNGYPCDWSG